MLNRFFRSIIVGTAVAGAFACFLLFRTVVDSTDCDLEILNVLSAQSEAGEANLAAYFETSNPAFLHAFTTCRQLAKETVQRLRTLPGVTRERADLLRIQTEMLMSDELMLV